MARPSFAQTREIGPLGTVLVRAAVTLPLALAGFLVALRMKGETVAEITGAAKVMRDRATPIRVGAVLDLDRDDINLDRETIIDTCGTGGSGTKSFNISTTVAFVVAAWL